MTLACGQCWITHLGGIMAAESRTKVFETFTNDRHQRMGLPFVPAIKVRAGTELVFVSGVLGTSAEMLPNGEPKPPGDIRIEAERVFTRIRDTLALTGADLGDVVKI